MASVPPMTTDGWLKKRKIKEFSAQLVHQKGEEELGVLKRSLSRKEASWGFSESLHHTIGR